MDTALWRPINISTWAMAALFVAAPVVTFAVVEAGNADVVGDAFAILVVMMLLNLGLALAPLVADRHWLLRLPVALLMLPVTAVLALGLTVGVGMVAAGTEAGVPVWAVVPALLIFTGYVSTGLRLLIVGTPASRLIRPTPRPPEPAERLLDSSST